MDRGGAETMLMNIYRKIDRQQFRFLFLVHDSKGGDYDNEIRVLGGEIYHINSLGNSNYIAYIKSFKKVIEQLSNVDIVHIHMKWQSGFIAYAAHCAGVKNIIIHSHNSGFYKKVSFYKNIAAKISKELIRRYSNVNFACSVEAAHFLFGKSGAIIINNAIDVDKHIYSDEKTRLTVRKSLNITDSDKLLIHVGSFSENKNQKFLIELFFKLAQIDKSYQLLLVGRGDKYFSETEILVNQLGLHSSVKLVGVKDNVPDYLHASDIFLFPSQREGFGMVVVEAQACGIPCIISEAVPKSVDLGLNLTRFIPLEIDEWITAIREQMIKPISNADIVEAIKEHHLDINDQVSKIENIYKKLVDGK
jgi:glycosyltransferase EpsF